MSQNRCVCGHEERYHYNSEGRCGYGNGCGCVLYRKCEYCDRPGGEPGHIETDNNGPIVPCPVCNGGSHDR